VKIMVIVSEGVVDGPDAFARRAVRGAVRGGSGGSACPTSRPQPKGRTKATTRTVHLRLMVLS
jgi:hypothetical protein